MIDTRKLTTKPGINASYMPDFRPETPHVPAQPCKNPFMSAISSDTCCQFSTAFAGRFGLEEAILWQYLTDIWPLFTPSPARVSVEALRQRFSFWQIADLQRICKSLNDKGVIQIQSPPLSQVNYLQFIVASPASTTTASGVSTATPQPTPTAQQPVVQMGANRISAHWQPDATLLQRLAAEHGISEKFSRSQVTEFVQYWLDSGKINHSWAAQFYKQVVRNWQRNKSEVQFLQASDEPASLARHWTPSADALEILERTGINRSFIEDAIPEFVLYWRERGGVTTTWNSKFIQHVKRQWARFTSTLKYDTEPRRVPANWQPDEEVFEILTMANIDRQFAVSCIAEFVLYWKDSNQLHSSWNTRFLQHVKYRWANQHQLQGLNHAKQQNPSGQGTATTSDFVAKHTDRSWADDL
ncbi:Primosomal protein 1 [BD1-7 clade bacterium]|uniref:Primosomal protein 1 n=1 Tax=BD1-7 clade bacterium TaxID=2029982 RepID=A0A5S9MTV9_9GAMM|nr:Primosomal protein 1 [BD1-7 clade bacterium]CAA0083927.1 Primosomal protein 1 [BD1-7 clade bacterium]